jgi:hypothetical protein
LAYPVAVDEVRIYKDRYLPPVNAVTYDATSQSIRITGWGATLQSIAAAVNNASIFAYNASTNTATAYRDIVVDRGSRLTIDNGTLLLSSNTDGGRKIKYYTDAIFELTNATIDSANSHFSCSKMLLIRMSTRARISRVIPLSRTLSG